ncbi:sulfotransferase, partial [bacterium]|nr:sulfotransferase [bacterium]
ETFMICKAKFNCHTHEVRYEDLLEDTIGETSSILKFLNLSWEPQMENYREKALTRQISTPSYSQVVQPIYKDAKYRWLNYDKYLSNYLDQLAPWISEFAYSKN